MPVRREVKLVAELLYAGLTTGVGLQTLGEEYCDIIQAAGLFPLSAALLHAGSFTMHHVAMSTPAEPSMFAFGGPNYG